MGRRFPGDVKHSFGEFSEVFLPPPPLKLIFSSSVDGEKSQSSFAGLKFATENQEFSFISLIAGTCLSFVRFTVTPPPRGYHPLNSVCSSVREGRHAVPLRSPSGGSEGTVVLILRVHSADEALLGGEGGGPST